MWVIESVTARLPEPGRLRFTADLGDVRDPSQGVEMTTAPMLIASRVIYYQRNDERTFLDWLSRIDCVDSYRGEGDALYILLKRKPRREDLHGISCLLLSIRREHEAIGSVFDKKEQTLVL